MRLIRRCGVDDAMPVTELFLGRDTEVIAVDCKKPGVNRRHVPAYVATLTAVSALSLTVLDTGVIRERVRPRGRRGALRLRSRR